MNEKFLYEIEGCIRAIEQLKAPKALQFMQDVAQALAACFRRGNQLIIAGNGGSLCDAAHFAEELTGFFRKKRKALPAIALSEPGHLTCVGNDVGFDSVFSRGVEAYGRPGDIFIGLSTSGNSLNIIKAFHRAQELGLQTISFLGKDGGHLKNVADCELIIEGFGTSDHIQEAHMAAIHMIIAEMEYLLFDQMEETTTDSISLKKNHEE